LISFKFFSGKESSKKSDKETTQAVSHWTKQKEAASEHLPRLLLLLFKLLPSTLMRLCAFPVSLCYYLFSPRARGESRRFLEMVKMVKNGKKVKNTQGAEWRFSVYKHFASFALTVVDKVQAWGGKIDLDKIRFIGSDIRELIGRLERKEGALLICSHLGNAEMLRALADYNRIGVSRNIPVISIVNFSVTEKFNRMLKELNPSSMKHLIGADSIGVETAELLQDCIADGGLVVIAGDRTPENTQNRCFTLPFLGRNAPFASGPFYLAALLNTEAYFVFALRENPLSVTGNYGMFVYKSPVSFDCTRSERNGRAETLARAFAERLEELCKEYPYEWYNFYDFWNGTELGEAEHER